jgi:hypothetical protein
MVMRTTWILVLVGLMVAGTAAAEPVGEGSGDSSTAQDPEVDGGTESSEQDADTNPNNSDREICVESFGCVYTPCARLTSDREHALVSPVMPDPDYPTDPTRWRPQYIGVQIQLSGQCGDS